MMNESTEHRVGGSKRHRAGSFALRIRSSEWGLRLALAVPAFLVYCLSWAETAGLCALLILLILFIHQQPASHGNWLSLRTRGKGGKPDEGPSSKFPAQDERGEFWEDSGLALFPAALLILTLVFHRSLPIVAATWGLVALGGGLGGAADELLTSASEIAGMSWGRPKLPFNPEKTWIRFLTFVLFGTAGAWLLLLWTSSSYPTTKSLLICLAAAVVGAGVDNAPLRLDNSLTVPVITGAFIFCIGLITRTAFDENLPYLGLRIILAIVLNLAFALAALRLTLVSFSGAVAGFFFGVAIYMGFGYKTFLILLAFFVLGSGATRLGYETKKIRKIAERRAGARSWREASANLASAAFFSILAITTPYQSAFLAAFLAALAEAAGDTVSSEIGKWLSPGAWMITTLKPVPAGLDGGISGVGTAAGLGASGLLVALGYGLGLAPGWNAVIVLAAALVGNFADSFLGATLERRGYLTNGAVNFAGTTLAGAIALAFALHY